MKPLLVLFFVSVSIANPIGQQTLRITQTGDSLVFNWLKTSGDIASYKLEGSADNEAWSALRENIVTTSTALQVSELNGLSYLRLVNVYKSGVKVAQPSLSFSKRINHEPKSAQLSISWTRIPNVVSYSIELEKGDSSMENVATGEAADEICDKATQKCTYTVTIGAEDARKTLKFRITAVIRDGTIAVERLRTGLQPSLKLRWTHKESASTYTIEQLNPDGSLTELEKNVEASEICSSMCEYTVHNVPAYRPLTYRITPRRAPRVIKVTVSQENVMEEEEEALENVEVKWTDIYGVVKYSIEQEQPNGYMKLLESERMSPTFCDGGQCRHTVSVEASEAGKQMRFRITAFLVDWTIVVKTVIVNGETGEITEEEITQAVTEAQTTTTTTSAPSTTTPATTTTTITSTIPTTTTTSIPSTTTTTTTEPTTTTTPLQSDIVESPCLMPPKKLLPRLLKQENNELHFEWDAQPDAVFYHFETFQKGTEDGAWYNLITTDNNQISLPDISANRKVYFRVVAVFPSCGTVPSPRLPVRNGEQIEDVPDVECTDDREPTNLKLKPVADFGFTQLSWEPVQMDGQVMFHVEAAKESGEWYNVLSTKDLSAQIIDFSDIERVDYRVLAVYEDCISKPSEVLNAPYAPKGCEKSQITNQATEGSKVEFHPETESESVDDQSKAYINCLPDYCTMRLDKTTNDQQTDEKDEFTCTSDGWAGTKQNVCVLKTCEKSSLAAPSEGSNLNFPPESGETISYDAQVAISCKEGTYLTERNQTDGFYYTSSKTHYAACKCSSWVKNDIKCSKLPETITLYQSHDTRKNDYNYVDKAGYDIHGSRPDMELQGVKGEVLARSTPDDVCPEKIRLQSLVNYYDYSPDHMDHVYTTSESLMKELRNQWWENSLKYYCVPAIGQCGATVLWARYKNTETDNMKKRHYFTPAPEGRQIPEGFEYEADECYIWKQAVSQPIEID